MNARVSRLAEPFSAPRWAHNLLLAVTVMLAADAIGQPAHGEPDPGREVHTFYYPWYGTPETDGNYAHWNHAIVAREGPSPGSYPGGDDIGANFYPALGAYSSNDPETLGRHMEMLKRARVDVISASWWGKGTFSDRALRPLFAAAETHGISINIHIEPFPGRNAATTREAIVYLIDTFGDSPAFYRNPSHEDRPMFYLYDSYRTPAEEWARLLKPDGSQTIRGGDYNSLVIALWVKKDERAFMIDGGFDGFYTYFATDGFTYGSTTANWRDLGVWARRHDLLFIPCVGPGYLDLRVRPWNRANVRDRENGRYYDHMFRSAIASGPDIIGLTSFNEWHEGTQIEPAVPKKTADFTYQNYGSRGPDYYLDRTAYWVERFIR